MGDTVLPEDATGCYMILPQYSIILILSYTDTHWNMFNLTMKSMKSMKMFHHIPNHIPNHTGCRYFYFCFFVAMITHRAFRDEQRCAKKYGATWEKYIKAGGGRGKK